MAQLHPTDLPRISVVIPTLNEAGSVATAIASATTSDQTEVIVVDGGSTDATRDIVQSLGVKVYRSAKGRAMQMNAGAAVATGDILLFLHADTRLPFGFERLVTQALYPDKLDDSAAPIAGAFALKIDASSPQLRWIERGVNWRSQILQLPYGDQALFLRRSTFAAIGGFPALPIMEDFEFVRRLQRQGKIVLIPDPVITSGRRWQQRGIATTTLINQLIVVGYLLGIPPQQLEQLYRRKPWSPDS